MPSSPRCRLHLSLGLRVTLVLGLSGPLPLGHGLVGPLCLGFVGPHCFGLVGPLCLGQNDPQVVDDLPVAIRTDGAKLDLLANTEVARIPYPC